MDKYFSCPICGEPEPKELEHFSDNGTEVWILLCHNQGCNKVIKVEDITIGYYDNLKARPYYNRSL